MTRVVEGAAESTERATVGAALQRYRGAGPGFDFWRMFLSTAVILLHCFSVSYGFTNDTPAWRWGGPVFAAVLPIFFGLSGFLVTGSAFRTPAVGNFLMLRALRLVPALTVEVTLSALILGPLLTEVALSDYFTDHKFFVYWGNIVGRVRFELPGLFEHNPFPRVVNRNLWTLHAELECYALMAVAMVTRLLFHRTFLTIAWALGTVGLFVAGLMTGIYDTPGVFHPSLLVYSFCTGAVAYLWRDSIPLSGRWCAGAVMLYLVMLYTPHLKLFTIAPLSYVMMYVGMQPALSFGILRRGDYSYGLYLYGFVIQQSLALLFPALRHWYLMFPVALTLTLAFAALSWHMVEKPALRLKKLFRRDGTRTTTKAEPTASAAG